MNDLGQLIVSSFCVLPGFNIPISFVGDTICLGPGDENRLGSNCCILRFVGRDCSRVGRGAVLVGTATRVSHVCRPCAHNAHNAICNRHGTQQCATQFSILVFPLLLSIQRITRWHFLDSIDYWEREWIKKWPLTKQFAIARSVLIDPLLPHRVRNFIKIEGKHTAWTKARCIQCYSNLATQARYGPEYHALQKAVFSCLNRFSWCGSTFTVASGMNSKEIGEWMDWASKRGRFFYEADGVSWDSLVNEEHHALRRLFYSFLSDGFQNFANSAWHVVGSGRFRNGHLKYRLRGTVKSGHNDTTLWNSVLNVLIVADSLVSCGLTADVIVAGDDLLAVVHQSFDEKLLAEAQGARGLVVEYRKFDHLMDVSFMSGCFWPSLSGVVFTPKPGRLLARLFWTCKPPSRRNFAAYRDTVVLGLLPACAWMPVVGEFLRAHFSGCGRVVAVDKYQIVKQKLSAVVSDSVLVSSFFLKYKLSSSRILKSTGHCGVLVDPTTEAVSVVDLAPLLERPTVGTAYVGGVHDPRLSVA